MKTSGPQDSIQVWNLLLLVRRTLSRYAIYCFRTAGLYPGIKFIASGPQDYIQVWNLLLPVRRTLSRYDIYCFWSAGLYPGMKFIASGPQDSIQVWNLLLPVHRTLSRYEIYCFRSTGLYPGMNILFLVCRLYTGMKFIVSGPQDTIFRYLTIIAFSPQVSSQQVHDHYLFRSAGLYQGMTLRVLDR
jgi:hypothetical protein